MNFAQEWYLLLHPLWPKLKNGCGRWLKMLRSSSTNLMTAFLQWFSSSVKKASLFIGGISSRAGKSSLILSNYSLTLRKFQAEMFLKKAKFKSIIYWRNHLLCRKKFIDKGQIISECPYEIIVSPIRPTKKISEISALASKERSHQ